VNQVLSLSVFLLIYYFDVVRITKWLPVHTFMASTADGVGVKYEEGFLGRGQQYPSTLLESTGGFGERCKLSCGAQNGALAAYRFLPRCM